MLGEEADGVGTPLVFVSKLESLDRSDRSNDFLFRGDCVFGVTGNDEEPLGDDRPTPMPTAGEDKGATPVI